MPMFCMTGSTMNAATSPLRSTRSSASGSLYGTTIVSPTTPRVMPADDATECGASAGPALSSDGFIDTMTSS